MCMFTLITILLQTEFAPYRIASDNRVALLAQVLVFVWFVFVSSRLISFLACI